MLFCIDPVKLGHRPLGEYPRDEDRVPEPSNLFRPQAQMVSRHKLVPEVPHPAQLVLADIRVPLRGDEVRHSGRDSKVDHGRLQAHDIIADEGHDGCESLVG